MISVSETPKPITIIGEAWEKAPKWMDKNYLFKHKDTYYLSWGRDYAIVFLLIKVLIKNELL